MVETRKRKNKARHLGDDKSLPITGSSQSDDVTAISDDAEVDTRANLPKACKKELRGESSGTTKTRRSSADSGPHVCRFCDKRFLLSQALGGHMNRHRSEKQNEEMQKAEALVAQRQQFMGLGNPWNMQGGGGNPYYDATLNLSSPPGPALGTSSRQIYLPNQSAATLQNPQLNQVLAPQQNAQVFVHSSMQGGGYYSPVLDNYARTHYGTPSQGNIISTGQFQGQHPNPTPEAMDSLLHGGANPEEYSHGHGVYQGGLSDTLNLDSTSSSRNQQIQQMTSGDHSFEQSAMQFVDQHENFLQHEFQPLGQDLSQDYTQTESLPQNLGSYGGSLRNEPSESTRSEHILSSTHEAYGNLRSLDGSQDIQGGIDQSTLMESQVQLSFDTILNTSITDIHTSGRLP